MTSYYREEENIWNGIGRALKSVRSHDYDYEKNDRNKSSLLAEPMGDHV